MFQTDSLDDVSVPVGLFCNSGEVTFAYGLVQILSFRKLSLEKYYCIMVCLSRAKTSFYIRLHAYTIAYNMDVETYSNFSISERICHV